MYYLLIALFALTGCSQCAQTEKPKENCTTSTITKIGVCNEDGYCGILLDTGTTASMYLPVEGTTVKVCKSEYGIFVRN